MRAVLRILLAVGLAGCANASSGVAWPKQAAREPDGGESLAPRSAAVAIESSKDDSVIEMDVPTVKPEPKPAEVKPKPAETPVGPRPTQDDGVITTEEIIIEIDD